MSINHRIFDFPLKKTSSQLFHVPGAGFEGGLTSGGAKVFSPEPAGFSVLELTPGFTFEWNSPFASWFMSKLNGEIFRIQLTRTPQLVQKFDEIEKTDKISFSQWDNSSNWDNSEPWSDYGPYCDVLEDALEGELYIYFDVSVFGQSFKPGHVIGLGNHSYMIDDIEYDGTKAKVKINPPLRKSTKSNQMVFLRPYFLGTVSNPDQIRNSYDVANQGAVQIGKIWFNEAII